MKLPILAALVAAAFTASGAFAQSPNSMQQHPSAAPHGPGAHPSYAIHPGAKGFVQRPMWRHPVHLPANGHGHSHFRFYYGGHPYVVLAGPIFVAPYASYPFVSTPYYPASFYAPGDPDGGYFLYYCPSPAGYYPDVTDCPAGWWQTVPDDAPQYPG